MTVAAVVGEQDATVWAGLATLIGLLLGVLAAAAAYESEQAKTKDRGKRATAWALGFAALFFASLGGAIGLGGLAGDAGWGFLVSALGITILIAGAIVRRGQLRRYARQRGIFPFNQPDAEQRNSDADEQEKDGGQ
jgi:MFS family permease